MVKTRKGLCGRKAATSMSPLTAAGPGDAARAPRHPIAPARVRVQLAKMRRPSRVSIERVDATHANAKRRWQRMGAPEYLDAAKLEQLHAASRLTRTVCPSRWSRDGLEIDVTLPPHGVALVTAEVSGR